MSNGWDTKCPRCGAGLITSSEMMRALGGKQCNACEDEDMIRADEREKVAEWHPKCETCGHAVVEDRRTWCHREREYQVVISPSRHGCLAHTNFTPTDAGEGIIK